MTTHRLENAWRDYKRQWAKSIHPLGVSSDIDKDAKRLALRAFRAGWRAAMRSGTRSPQ